MEWTVFSTMSVVMETIVVVEAIVGTMSMTNMAWAIISTTTATASFNLCFDFHQFSPELFSEFVTL
jgi:hypothetical protein